MKPQLTLATREALAKIHTELGGPLHGTERLRMILRSFYEKMASDVMIGFFFEGKDLHEIAERQLEFLLKAMGVEASYTGKAPGSAHDSLPPILSGHFDRRRVLLEQTLKSHGVSNSSITTWLAFEEAFRAAIVESKPTDA